MPARKCVLIVDDNNFSRRMVASRLRADGYDVAMASHGDEALRMVGDLQPDVILLDVDMPGLDGFKTCQRLKEDSATRLIPVIFVTGKTTIDDKIRGLDLGAIDYVSKPFIMPELMARVRSAYRIKSLMDLLEEQAQIDGLTGLHNRAYFDRRVLEEVERASRYQLHLSLVIMDVDGFKQLNDTFGHRFGDDVLCAISKTLRSIPRATDLVARYGGEEFVTILPEQHLEGAGLFANRVRQAVEQAKHRYHQDPVGVTASFGVSSLQYLGIESATAQHLVDSADKALYAAKQCGRNRVCWWEFGRTVEVHVGNPSDDELRRLPSPGVSFAAKVADR